MQATRKPRDEGKTLGDVGGKMAMELRLDRHSRVPLYLQLVRQLRSQIASGRLGPQYHMPPERELAQTLGVNRSTIVQVYQQLRQEGLIVSQVGKGTFVSGVVQGRVGDATVGTPPWQLLFSDYANRFTYHDIAAANEAQNPSISIDFATGSPNPHEIPDELLREVTLRAYSSHDVDGQPESPIEGFDALRELLAEHSRRQQIDCRARNIMVLSGSEQGIDLCVRAFINPHDVVLVEQSTFFPALQALRSADARIIPVPIDEHGMNTEVLAGLCARFHPKMIYTNPTFHNPTGSTLTLERRRELIAAAINHRCLIVEDDPYGELRYDGNQVTPLKGMENTGYVVYLSTFSKTITPGLRTGWLIADSHVITRLASLRRMIDQHTSISSRRICMELLRGPHATAHVRRLIRSYRSRRDAMCEALQRWAPDGLRWTKPDGGYYVWCTLPEGVLAQSLLRRTMARGVTFMPGDVFDADGHDESHIRLNFVRPDMGLINEGVRLLCECVKDASSTQSL